ncbi:MAG: type II secretion system inner membrane protein GspF [Pseudomonadota bacterium]|nr:type II secretion system inner membrane protein GspF [Pseudomonadota bacterium]
MAVFKYVATDKAGKITRGFLEGDSASAIRQQLRDMDKTPIEVSLSEERKTTTSGARWQMGFHRSISNTDLAMITFQFATLLNAGLPVEEALLNLAEQHEKTHVKAILLGVHAKVTEGHSLATGMAVYPRSFPSMYRASVAAGERSGQLDNVLARLSEYLERQQAVQQKIQNALVYPAILTFVSISVVSFLLAYVVPKIVTVFMNTGQALPTITIVLLAISGFVQKFGLLILFIIAATVIGVSWLLRKPVMKRRFQLLLLHLPVIGNTIREVNSARFARTFGILFAASVPVLEAMSAASSVVKLLPMQDAIGDAINKVSEGVAINRALQSTGYFSLLSVRLIAAGEMTGRLEVMLEKCSDYQERIVAQKIDLALALFEPGMILLMGMIVLFIVLAIMLPIFEINQFIH